MKAIKFSIFKLILLCIVFIGTIGLYFAVTYEEVEDPTETISTATLPVITMQYGEQNINILHGYTMEMQGQYMRGAITPYGDSGKIQFNIERYGNVIAGISYEIRSSDTERLIDNREVTEWTTDGEKFHVTLDLSSIMEKDEEYLLIIQLIQALLC